MRRPEAFQGVRMTVFLSLLRRWESAELNQEEAAELLGVSERTFRRWTRRYEEEGEAGLIDRRLGKGLHPGGPGGRNPFARERFETNFAANLYTLWNRMSSGSYFPLPVKACRFRRSPGACGC